MHNAAYAVVRCLAGWAYSRFDTMHERDKDTAGNIFNDFE